MRAKMAPNTELDDVLLYEPSTPEGKLTEANRELARTFEHNQTPVKADGLKPGQELILNEGLNVVEAAGYEIQGEVVVLKEVLDTERAVVTQRADEDRVGIIADPLRQVQLKT